MAAKPLRFLTFRHAQNVKKARQEAEEGDIVTAQGRQPALEPLDDGYQRLYSYFQPALGAGTYQIAAKQKISATKDGETQSLDDKKSSKTFTVEAAQYSLPEGCVHSVNPAEGQMAPAEMLPSIVFGDAHMPWERNLPFPDDKEKREAMPWLALLVFDQDEVHIAQEHLAGESSIFKDTDVAKQAETTQKPISQSSTFAINMSLFDVNVIKSKATELVASPIPVEKKDDKGTKLDVVFVQTALFNKFITTYENGVPKAGQMTADLSRYKYLAHVRHVKTDGMAASADYTKGLFSVILSHRLGPLSETKEQQAIAHLVSLENWATMNLVDSKIKYVALNSLYSWTYTSMPMGGFNLADAFKVIGNGIHVLRTPEDTINEVEKNKSKIALKLAQRLRDGYTLTKYRTQTGEETTAFIRAALIPSVPTHPLVKGWTAMSHSGINLQILDQQTGLMDITYSAAWNLGKSLALADSSFTTSLARLRRLVLAPSLNSGKKAMLRDLGAFVSRMEILESIVQSMSTLNAITNKTDENAPKLSPENRWNVNFNQNPPDLTMANPSVISAVESAATRKARKLAGSLDDDDESNEKGKKLYNELNTPCSSDWKIVLSWIIDRMFLFGIPPHYLIADQKFLPQESLRFFYIDPNWMDSLIDGALSLANSVSPTDDFVRRSIKSAINAYLNTKDNDTGYKPQIPSYGMLLRSDIITQYPDLRVEAPIVGGVEADRAPILRQEIVGDGILLCLFDRSPAGDELSQLSFTQPPHQQTFEAAFKVKSDNLKVRYKKAYTSTKLDKDQYKFGMLTEKDIDRLDPEKDIDSLDPKKRPRLFLWGENNESRFLLMDAWTKDVFTELTTRMAKSEFDDTLVTSALVGFQLGTPIYQLLIQKGQKENLQVLNAAPAARSLKLMHSALRAEMQQLQLSSLEAALPIPELLEMPLLHERFPHVSSISRISTDEKRVSDSGGLADKPTYVYQIGPIKAKYEDFGKLTSTGQPEDLVFSIVRNKRPVNQLPPYYLTEILIKIPLGEPINDLYETANLMRSYDGPGPTMLSNLRFNVFAERSDSWLWLRIVSRSPSGASVKKVQECSFLLPLVEVYALESERTIAITYEEAYAIRNPEDPRNPTFKGRYEDHFDVHLIASLPSK